VWKNALILSSVRSSHIELADLRPCKTLQLFRQVLLKRRKRWHRLGHSLGVFHRMPVRQDIELRNAERRVLSSFDESKLNSIASPLFGRKPT
jgi:hypothetical protein